MAVDKDGVELAVGDTVLVQCSVERLDDGIVELEPLIHGESPVRFHLEAGSCESLGALLKRSGADFEKRLELASEEDRQEIGRLRGEVAELREKLDSQDPAKTPIPAPDVLTETK